MSKDYVMQLEATIENLRRDNSLLKEQATSYKKVLEVIKEKKVNIELLNASSSVEDYNNEVIRNYGYAFSTNRIFTQEEFDLLKRWLG